MKTGQKRVKQAKKTEFDMVFYELRSKTNPVLSMVLDLEQMSGQFFV